MALSARLQAVLEALPLEPGMRVLEVGAGPGALARELARLVGDAGVVVACDRSATAVRQMREGCADAIASGRMRVVHAAIEDLELDETFDLVVACRVGALDGRHPEVGARALDRIRALAPEGRLLIDDGDPLREVPLR